MTITNSNLFSEPFNVIKSWINSIQNFDPRGRYKGNFIHSSMPNVNDKGFDGFPFLILKVDIEEGRKSTDSSTSEKIFRISLSIYSPESTQVDSMADKIRENLSSLGISDKTLSSSPITWNLDEHGKKIHFRNVGIIARERI
jgi:hypothetical protein